MVNFTTYGMAGVGIAAAIGFVFALSLLSNNNSLNGQDLTQQAPSPFSSLQQKAQPPGDNEGNVSTEGGAAKMQAAINNESAASDQASANLRPTLTSVVALNSNREMISEIAPDMEFRRGTPVFIQANFANGNEAEILQHTITISIRSENGSQSDENIASFQGNIAGSSNVALELYWQPGTTGEFTILVFSMTPDDPASTEPIAAIPVRVA